MCKTGLVCVELHFWTVLETNFDPVKYFMNTVLIRVILFNFKLIYLHLFVFQKVQIAFTYRLMHFILILFEKHTCVQII